MAYNQRNGIYSTQLIVKYKRETENFYNFTTFHVLCCHLGSGSGGYISLHSGGLGLRVFFVVAHFHRFLYPAIPLPAPIYLGYYSFCRVGEGRSRFGFSLYLCLSYKTFWPFLLSRPYLLELDSRSVGCCLLYYVILRIYSIRMMRTVKCLILLINTFEQVLSQTIFTVS